MLLVLPWELTTLALSSSDPDGGVGGHSDLEGWSSIVASGLVPGSLDACGNGDFFFGIGTSTDQPSSLCQSPVVQIPSSNRREKGS